MKVLIISKGSRLLNQKGSRGFRVPKRRKRFKNNAFNFTRKKMKDIPNRTVFDQENKSV